MIGGTTLLTVLLVKYFNECLHWRTIATWTRWNYWRYFAVWILSIVEKRLHKIVPNAIDIIVTPTIALLIVDY